MKQKLSLDEEAYLIEQSKNNIQAFGELYDYYFPKLYGYVLYMVQNHSEAEDIVSSTFEKAIVHLPKYQNQGFSFGAWLFRIAKNLIYDRGKAKVTVSLGDYMHDESSEDVEKQVEDQIELKTLKDCVEKLKPAEREVIILRYLEGYTIKEVCDITGRSEDSIKSSCKRSLSKIRQIMQLSPAGMFNSAT